MKQMQRVLALLIAPALFLALAGCGGTSTGGDDAPDYRGQTLTVLYPSGPYADAARSIASEFEAGTAAKLKVVDVSRDELYDAIASDTLGQYGAVLMPAAWDGAFAERMADLGGYLAEVDEDSDMVLDRFIPRVLENCGTWEGRVHGIPAAASPWMLAFRSDLLPGGPDSAWEALAKQAAYSGSVLGGAEDLAGLFKCMLWSLGGELADVDWQIAVDSPEARQALELLVSMNWSAQNRGEATRAFLDGSSALCLAWPDPTIARDGDDPFLSQAAGNWAIASLPQGGVLLDAWDIAIPAASEQQDLAWEWIQLYAKYENQVRFYEEYGILSPRAAFWERDGVWGGGLEPTRAALDTANPGWRVAASVEADALLDRELNLFLSGTQDLDATLSHLDAGLREALAANPIPRGVLNQNR
ncbi:MAG: extracellular solute-binding protein [Oscillospiraceae bacterium]|nr:extracellular solute-binding protein [Oscillospiraceae bacterium]